MEVQGGDLQNWSRIGASKAPNKLVPFFFWEKLSSFEEKNLSVRFSHFFWTLMTSAPMQAVPNAVDSCSRLHVDARRWPAKVEPHWGLQSTQQADASFLWGQTLQFWRKKFVGWVFSLFLNSDD
jgi:hypothetical protein